MQVKNKMAIDGTHSYVGAYAEKIYVRDGITYWRVTFGPLQWVETKAGTSRPIPGDPNDAEVITGQEVRYPPSSGGLASNATDGSERPVESGVRYRSSGVEFPQKIIHVSINRPVEFNVINDTTLTVNTSDFNLDETSGTITAFVITRHT